MKLKVLRVFTACLYITKNTTLHLNMCVNCIRNYCIEYNLLLLFYYEFYFKMYLNFILVFVV